MSSSPAATGSELARRHPELLHDVPLSARGMSSNMFSHAILTAASQSATHDCLLQEAVSSVTRTVERLVPPHTQATRAFRKINCLDVAEDVSTRANLESHNGQTVVSAPSPTVVLSSAGARPDKANSKAVFKSKHKA